MAEVNDKRFQKTDLYFIFGRVLSAYYWKSDVVTFVGLVQYVVHICPDCNWPWDPKGTCVDGDCFVRRDRRRREILNNWDRVKYRNTGG